MVDDGWCGVCQTTTDGNCLHLEDGTNIPDPAWEIKKLQAENERLQRIEKVAKTIIVRWATRGLGNPLPGESPTDTDLLNALEDAVTRRTGG